MYKKWTRNSFKAKLQREKMDTLQNVKCITVERLTGIGTNKLNVHLTSLNPN